MSLEDSKIFQLSKLSLVQSSADTSLCENESATMVGCPLHITISECWICGSWRFFPEEKRSKIIQGKRAGRKRVGNDYSRTQVVQQIIRMCR